MTAGVLANGRRSRVLFLCLAAAGIGAAMIARSAAQVGPRPDPAAPAAPAALPEKDPPEPPPPVLLTRVYDVRDLLVDIPNFTNAPDLLADDLNRTIEADRQIYGRGGSFGGSRWEVGKTREQRAEDVVRLIQETIAPDTWREQGGMIGGIRELDGQLIVTQIEENHRLLRQLLEQLREVQYVNVRIRVHWVLVDRPELDRVLKPVLPQRARPATQAAATLPAGS